MQNQSADGIEGVLGGLLTILMEVQLIARSGRTDLIDLAQRRTLGRLISNAKLANLTDSLEIDPHVISEVLKFDELATASSRHVPAHSLLRLNNAWNLGKLEKPALRWKPSAWASLQVRLAELNRPYVAFHFRGTSEDTRRFDGKLVQTFLELLDSPLLDGYVPLVLGDQVPDSVRRRQDVYIAEHNGWALHEQLMAATASQLFVGQASGFCSSVIFSHTRYLLFKDPLQHHDTVERDIGPAGQIPFANENQILLRAQPTVPQIFSRVRTLLGGAGRIRAHETRNRERG